MNTQSASTYIGITFDRTSAVCVVTGDLELCELLHVEKVTSETMREHVDSVIAIVERYPDARVVVEQGAGPSGYAFQILEGQLPHRHIERFSMTNNATKALFANLRLVKNLSMLKSYSADLFTEISDFIDGATFPPKQLITALALATWRLSARRLRIEHTLRDKSPRLQS